MVNPLLPQKRRDRRMLQQQVQKAKLKLRLFYKKVKPHLTWLATAIFQAWLQYLFGGFF